MAVFGLVCAPTVSRAVAAARGDSAWVEVCSAQGTRRVWLPASDDGASPAQVQHHPLQACALCVLAAAGMAPTSPVSGLAPALLPGHGCPQRPLVQVDTAPHHPASQPRAPPVPV